MRRSSPHRLRRRRRHRSRSRSPRRPAPASRSIPAERRAPALKVVTVRGGLDNPTGFTFAPNGRIWYIEKNTGRVYILNRDTGRRRLFTDITGVSGLGERGGLGIALHPDWPARPFVYVYVTRTDGGVLQNELLRFRSEDDHAAATERLFGWRVNSATNHNGGRILFGPDGNLWIVTGENADPRFSQQRAQPPRARSSGSSPTARSRTRTRSAPASTPPGIRNSFGMAFDPETGPALGDRERPGLQRRDQPDPPRRATSRGVRTSPAGRGPRRSTRTATARTASSPRSGSSSTLGHHGRGLLRRCGLGAARNGDLFYGDVNTAHLYVSELNASRTGIVGGARGRARALDRRLLDGGRAAAPHLLQRTERDLPPRRPSSAARRSGGVGLCGTGPPPWPASREDGMNIGRPQRIIEVQPASVPLPDPVAPGLEPGPGDPRGRAGARRAPALVITKPSAARDLAVERATEPILAWRAWALTGRRDGSDLLLRPVAGRSRPVASPRGRRGRLQTRAAARRAERRLFVRPPRDPRGRDPAPHPRARRPRPRGALGRGSSNTSSATAASSATRSCSPSSASSASGSGGRPARGRRSSAGSRATSSSRCAGRT